MRSARQKRVIVPAASALLVLAAAAPACSSFGTSATPEPAEASVDGQAQADASPSPSLDAALARPDAASCDPPVVLDFESASTFPPPNFSESSSPTGATLSVVGNNSGAGGSAGALRIDLDVQNTTSSGPYAKLFQHFPVTAADLQLELSFDFNGPAAPGLYAAAGCALTFRPSTATTPRTDITIATTNNFGPRVEVSSTPAIGAILRGPSSSTAGGYRHLDLTVTIEPGGMTAVVQSTLDGMPNTLTSVPLHGPPADVTLSCGFYADSALGHFTAYVDNVRFAVCRAP